MDRNQKILIFIVFIIICIAVVCGVLAFKELKNNKDVKINKFKEEYEALNGVVNDNNGYMYPTVEIPIDSNIVYSTEEEILELLNSKTDSGVIYFGFPTCPWCRNAIGPLISAAESTGTDKIYYLNVLDIRDSLSISDEGEIVIDKVGSDGYYKILKKLDKVLDTYYVYNALDEKFDTNEKRLYVPAVVTVAKGKVIGFHTDTVESHIDGYTELTVEQKEELFNIYTNMILEMNDSACNTTKKGGC